MTRYGEGSERFAGDANKIAAGRAQMEEMLRKEAAAEEASVTTTGRANVARSEAADITKRMGEASRQAASDIKLETAAVEELARARARANAAGRISPVLGGLDSHTLAAYSLTEGGTSMPSQKQLRRTFNIGSDRARNINLALGAGMAPEGATPVNVQSALRDEVITERALAEANRTLTNLKRRAVPVEQSEINQALLARDQAREAVAAARGRTAAAREEAAAFQQNIEALRAEAQARQQAAAAAKVNAGAEGGGTGTALALRREFIPGALGGGPQTGQAQVFAPGPRNPLVGRQNVQEVPPNLYGSGHPLVIAQAESAAHAEDAARNTQAQAQAAAKASTALNEQAAATVRVSAATREAAVVQRLYSDEMHRHGALTAEFIQASLRGEVTIRQLGSEMAVTIGKFAGWTAAASAVYGAARAIGVLGRGAIDAQSGVHTLDRVINNVNPRTAVQSFGDLSRQFNVPINQAVDAVYRMGQVFHNQADAVTAARAALYSYKTGEVDVATSTQNLIAIQRGFHLSADQLLSIYNQINQAQNVFGVRIGDTEKGMANAAGTWRNAGGDLTYMLSLFTAINKATAQSGSTIGTAVNRAVTQFRTPTHEKTLKSLGIDYDPADLQKTIESAIAVAQRATTSGLQRRQIAQSLFGNQYARLIEPILSDPSQLREAQRRLDPTRSDVQTSAARELAKVLKQVDEQVKSIGNTMERIGAQMEQAGFFDFAGLLLRGTTTLLSTVEQLLKLFNMLPAPLTHSLVLLGEMAIVLRTLGRVGLGERIQSLPIIGGFTNPGNALKSQATRDQQAITDASRRRLEAEANQYATLTGEQRFTQAARGPYYADVNQQLKQGVQDPALREKLQADSAEWSAIVKSDEAAAQAARARVTLALQILEAEEENLAAIKGSTAANIESTLATRNISVTPVRGTTPAGEIAEPVTGGQYLTQLGDKGAVTQYSARAQRVMAQMELSLGTWSATAATFGRSGERVNRVTPRVIATTGRVVTSVENAAAGMRGMGGSLAAFGASLGPLDLALIGLPLGFEAIHLMQEAGNNAAKALDQAQALTSFSSAQDLKSKRDQAQSLADKGPSYWQKVAGADDLHPSILGTVFGATTWFDRNILGDKNAQSPAEQYRDQQDKYQKSADELARIQKLQAEEIKKGRPVSSRAPSDVVRDINIAAGQAKSGAITQREFQAALKKYSIEMETVDGGTKPQTEAMKEAFTNAQRLSADLHDYADALSKLDDKGFQKEVEATAQQLALFGANSREGQAAIKQLDLQYSDAARRWGGKGDAASVASLNQTRQALFSAIDEAASSLQTEGLSFARNEEDRQKAFRDADKLERARLQVDDTFTIGGGDHGAVTTVHDRHFRDAAARRQYRNDRQTRQDAAYQDRQDGRQIALAYQQSQQVDPLESSRLAVQEATAQVADARKKYGQKSRQYLQALTALNQAQQQQAQAILAQVQAQDALAEARAGVSGDPVETARAALQTARDSLRSMLANTDAFDPAQILQARAAVINAETTVANATHDQAEKLAQLRGDIRVARRHGDPVAQAQEAIRQANLERQFARNDEERLQATLDLITANNDLETAIRDRESARFDYLESLTADPGKKASIEVKKAANALKGLTPGTSDYYQAKAQYQDALRAQHQTRLQSREDDIDFELQMEKISTDEAIRRYHALLQMHNLTKQERRDILLKIKQLQKDADSESSGFGLRVGSIKLPTVYDVRRAIAEGRRNDAGHQMNFRNNLNLNVHVTSGADVRDVFNELDTQLGTSLTSQMRAAGLA